ncbi:MAG: hypothetical protein H6706_08415 [Myxococcales bacterium]|nr:hypothetical protein [Myxococcales bacterium]
MWMLVLALCAGPPAVTPTDERRVGAVAEALPAGPYCYVRLEGPDWLATLGACPAVAARVQARIFGWRQDHASARLGRRFERVGFATLTMESNP